MSRMILSLSAWKMSGKDTVADYLVKEYGFRKLSFAAALKDLVSTAYTIPRHYFDDQTLKELPLMSLPVVAADLSTQRVQGIFSSELQSGYWTPRALCILEGSVKRAVENNYWVSQAIQELRNNPTQNYVITDMRYKSEANAISRMFPENKVIRINRWPSSPTTDPSERDMDDFTFDSIMYNTYSKEFLYESTDILINSISSTF